MDILILKYFDVLSSPHSIGAQHGDTLQDKCLML